MLEDAKREAAGEAEAGAGAGDNKANGSSSEAAQQKKAKKKNKSKKRGQQWNKKATNLWVYVNGERKNRELSPFSFFCMILLLYVPSCGYTLVFFCIAVSKTSVFFACCNMHLLK